MHQSFLRGSGHAEEPDELITQYFLHVTKRPDRAKIKMEWIEETIKNADYTEVQSDGRIRKWKKIKEESKFLRVILLADGETLHNAFFDISFKGETT